MDYNSICKEILKIDPKVRYAGIYCNGEVYEHMQSGTSRLLNPEQTKKSLTQAVMRWKTRASHTEIIGCPVYALAKYEKISRVTMECGKDGLLMTSIENDLEPNSLAEKISAIIVKHSDD